MDGRPKKSKLWKLITQIAAHVLGKEEITANPTIENLEARQLLSSTYFVSPTGSDDNSGSLALPFKTIQRAANVAQAGDVVNIETGTYHETVTPKHSGTTTAPITFQAYNNETITITGADPIGNWTQYAGDIYDTPMSVNLGEGNNQVFADGQPLNEARFPNSSITDPSHPAVETIKSVKSGLTSAVISDPNLNQAANYWKGATIHFAPGQGWVAQTGTVTASSPGSISVSYASMGDSKNQIPVAGDPFYLVGKFQALDSAGEWYRDPTTGKLYIWTPKSNNPAGDDIEVKARQYAFDFTGQQDITLKGVHIFAATIKTSSASHNIVINGITASYISQFFSLSNGWWTAPSTSNGIMLMASGDVLENSTIAYASGDGVVISASGVTVRNNVIHDVDTIGGDMAGVRALAGGNVIDHNTIYNTGRDGIEASVAHMTITYNTIHDVGLQTTEPGGIYTVGVNGQGSVMAYNTVYNIHTGGWGGTGLFLDNNTSGWNVHNNVTYAVDYGMKLNYTCDNNNVYNNTLNANIDSLNTNQLGNWNGTSIYNNIFLKPAIVTRGAKITNNMYTASSSASMGAGSFTSGASGVSSTTPPPTTTPPPPPPPPSTPSATTKIMAVNYTGQSGTQSDGTGGVGYADNNDWISYKLDFGAGVNTFAAGLATINAGGSIEIHVGSATGALAGTLKVAVTGAWSNYTSESTAVTGLTGVQTIYLVFKGPVKGVANIDWLTFSNSGTTTPPVQNPPPTTTTALATSKVMAVSYAKQSGTLPDGYGGVGHAGNSDWVSYTLDFGAGVAAFTADVATVNPGGSIEIHVGSPTGTLAGTLNVAKTATWGTFTSQTATAGGLTGVQTIYLVFKGNAAAVANLEWFTFTAATTTPPTTGVPSATSKVMAVNDTKQSGTLPDGYGGVGHAGNNDWISYQLDFGAGVTSFTAGVATVNTGGTIEIHLGSPTGTLAGTLKVATTTGWGKYTSQSTVVSGLTGVQTVYLVFKGNAAAVANLDWLMFS